MGLNIDANGGDIANILGAAGGLIDKIDNVKVEHKADNEQLLMFGGIAVVLCLILKK
jgi:hypothetical protein